MLQLVRILFFHERIFYNYTVIFEKFIYQSQLSTFIYIQYKYMLSKSLFKICYLSETLNTWTNCLIYIFESKNCECNKFQRSLILRITTLLSWLKSTLLLKNKCFITTIYMKAQCLETNEMQHYWERKMLEKQEEEQRKSSANWKFNLREIEETPFGHRVAKLSWKCELI
jgi:hypothetical protein